MSKKLLNNGFTLIELLIVIGIIALLALVVFITLDPAEKFAMARNAQRWQDITTILNSVKHYQIAHEGALPPGFPEEPTIIGDGKEGTYDMSEYMTPLYLPRVPSDPRASSAYTCYSVGREFGILIVVRAECAELNESIELKW